VDQQVTTWENLELCGGRYAVKALLGEGGMGQAYRAWDRNVETDVVIKVPRRELLGDRDFASRFRREIRSLVQLTHPRIVKIIDVAEYDGVPFVVMQFLAGGSLDDQRARDRDGNPSPMEPESLPTWLPAVAEALDFVHGQGYVHRDVKPGNILFDAHGNAYLSDFGVVKALSSTETEGQRRSAALTGAGVALGTPEYMAPEVVMAEAFDGRSDQYALGVTIYEVLSAKMPITGPSAAAILVNQTARTPQRLSEQVSSIPRALSDAVMRCLSKSAGARFPDCTYFARTVLAALPEPAAASAPIGITPPQINRGSSGQLACPECGKILRLGETHAGRAIRCPQCKTALRVAKDLSSVSTSVSKSTARSAVPLESGYLDPLSRDATVPQTSQKETMRSNAVDTARRGRFADHQPSTSTRRDAKRRWAAKLKQPRWFLGLAGAAIAGLVGAAIALGILGW
jgi:serine/threonine protein kinase